MSAFKIKGKKIRRQLVFDMISEQDKEEGIEEKSSSSEHSRGKERSGQSKAKNQHATDSTSSVDINNPSAIRSSVSSNRETAKSRTPKKRENNSRACGSSSMPSKRDNVKSLSSKKKVKKQSVGNVNVSSSKRDNTPSETPLQRGNKTVSSHNSVRLKRKYRASQQTSPRSTRKPQTNDKSSSDFPVEIPSGSLGETKEGVDHPMNVECFADLVAKNQEQKKENSESDFEMELFDNQEKEVANIIANFLPKSMVNPANDQVSRSNNVDFVEDGRDSETTQPQNLSLERSVQKKKRGRPRKIQVEKIEENKEETNVQTKDTNKPPSTNKEKKRKRNQEIMRGSGEETVGMRISMHHRSSASVDVHSSDDGNVSEIDQSHFKSRKKPRSAVRHDFPRRRAETNKNNTLNKVLVDVAMNEAQSVKRKTTSFFVNSFKGGTGKTTICMNLAAGFAMNGEKTIIVDLDPQCNSSVYFDEVKGIKENKTEVTSSLSKPITKSDGGKFKKEDVKEQKGKERQQQNVFEEDLHISSSFFDGGISEDLLDDTVNYSEAESYFPVMQNASSPNNIFECLFRAAFVHGNFKDTVENLFSRCDGPIPVNTDTFEDNLWILKGSFAASIMNIAKNLASDLEKQVVNNFAQYSIFNLIIDWLSQLGFSKILFDTSPYPSDVNQVACMSSDFILMTAEPKLASLQGIINFTQKALNENFSHYEDFGWIAKRKKLLEIQEKNKFIFETDEFLSRFKFNTNPPKLLPVIFSNYLCARKGGNYVMRPMESNMVRSTANYLESVFRRGIPASSNGSSSSIQISSSISTKVHVQHLKNQATVIRLIGYMKLFPVCEELGRTVFDVDPTEVTETTGKYEKNVMLQERNLAIEKFTKLVQLLNAL